MNNWFLETVVLSLFYEYRNNKQKVIEKNPGLWHKREKPYVHTDGNTALLEHFFTCIKCALNAK